jgi:hypothetical protein
MLFLDLEALGKYHNHLFQRSVHLFWNAIDATLQSKQYKCCHLLTENLLLFIHVGLNEEQYEKKREILL